MKSERLTFAQSVCQRKLALEFSMEQHVIDTSAGKQLSKAATDL